MTSTLHELEAHRLGVEAVASLRGHGWRWQRGGKPCRKSATVVAHGFRPARARLRRSPTRSRQFRALVRRGGRGRRPPARGDDARDGDADGAADGPHRAAARPRRARLRLLHEPRERQGRASSPPTRAPRSCSTGASSNARCGSPGRSRGSPTTTRRATGRRRPRGHRIERVGVAAERGRRRRRRSRRGSPRSRRGSPTTDPPLPPFWGGYVVGVDELELLAGPHRPAARPRALPPRRRRAGSANGWRRERGGRRRARRHDRVRTRRLVEQGARRPPRSSTCASPRRSSR